MAGIGWNFGDNVSTAPPSSSLISSGWSSNYAPPLPQNSESQQQPSSRPIGIGFIIEEPPSSMAPQAKAPPTDMNSYYLGPAENPARRSLSVNAPRRPPPRQMNPTSLSFEVATPDGALVNEPGKARSEMNLRRRLLCCLLFINYFFQKFCVLLELSLHSLICGLISRYVSPFYRINIAHNLVE